MTTPIQLTSPSQLQLALKSQSNFVSCSNAPAEASWQSFVALVDRGNPSESIRSDEDTYARFDTPHRSAPDPWLLTQWRVDIGWHRAVNQTPAPQQIFKPARSASDAAAASPAEPTSPSLRFNQLLAEAAHDIRSPLAVAQQIISSVARRANDRGSLSPSDAGMLQEANLRLSQATRWAEGILIDQRLVHGEPVNVRRRFYPHQWRIEIEPLLRSIAAQRQVKLDWVGWDRSLPRLYLDSSHLSRAVLNLLNNAVEASPAGSRIRVEVAWQTNVTQRMIISIEDQGAGLETHLMRKINATELWPAQADEPFQAGLGLRTAKSLVRAIGGTISVQKSSVGGTLFRLSIPVDNYHSLIRSWLIQNADRARPDDYRSPKQLSIHALRTSVGIPTVDARALGDFDARLQRATSINDLVYRVAQDRWLWLSLQNQSSFKTAKMPPALTSVLRAAPRWEGLDGSGRRCLALKCLEQRVFQMNDVSLIELQAGAATRYRLPAITGAIAEKFAELMGSHVPPVDELDMGAANVAVRPWRDANSMHFRTDTGRSPLSPSKRSSESLTSLADTPSESFSGALAELSQAWHAHQRQLDNISSRISGHRTELTLSY